jgi:enoyl-CoA hydratase
MSTDILLADHPAEGVLRLTLNRPEKRNAISTPLRAALLDALAAADTDPTVRVSILRGAGPCFSSGYDLTAGPMMDGAPFPTSPGDGQWARHVTDSWLRIWDLAKPVIAQVHGYAIAGATELAAGCDLVYVAADARIGHPVVRVLSPPDFNYHPWLVGFRQSMELMLTGDSITGEEAARIGFANRAYPAETLEAEVLAIAERVAAVPPDLQQLNKRSVHRAMETMGVRAAIRNATEFQALAAHQPSAAAARADALARIKGAFQA